ncbi:FxsA family protein [Propioniciclava coleopterorum]|uniref:FxsA family protein n=1 Tax=Propioniciclava coleopterorum TaxID=2714937 RepID=A0A6G7YA25_9ACTN|nr:FxsA family protein [Propioniciclava coleopterorum]QIK73491.1 FxsA family protein [Propioniciclava coleopterorum]
MSLSRVTLVVLAVLAVAEIALLAWIAQGIGVGWTLLLLLAGGVVGGLIWRHEGSKAWASLRDAQAHPDEASARMSDAALVLTGGLLFLLPGILSDVVGLMFIIPATRPLARRGVKALFAGITRPYRDQMDLLLAQMDPGSVVEGETVRDPERPDRNTPKPDDPTVIKGEIEP